MSQREGAPVFHRVRCRLGLLVAGLPALLLLAGVPASHAQDKHYTFKRLRTLSDEYDRHERNQSEHYPTDPYIKIWVSNPTDSRCEEEVCLHVSDFVQDPAVGEDIPEFDNYRIVMCNATVDPCDYQDLRIEIWDADPGSDPDDLMHENKSGLGNSGSGSKTTPHLEWEYETGSSLIEECHDSNNPTLRACSHSARQFHGIPEVNQTLEVDLQHSVAALSSASSVTIYEMLPPGFGFLGTTNLDALRSQGLMISDPTLVELFDDGSAGTLISWVVSNPGTGFGVSIQYGVQSPAASLDLVRPFKSRIEILKTDLSVERRGPTLHPLHAGLVLLGLPALGAYGVLSLALALLGAARARERLRRRARSDSTPS